MLKKCFLGIHKYAYCKKWFWTISMKCLPMGKGSSYAMLYHSPSIYEKHADKNMWKYQYEDRYSSLKLQMCIKTIKKYTFHMPHNCWQMNYVDKICIGDIEHYMYCKKYFWNISMKCLPHGFICHAMSLHPWSMPSISVVSKFIINNISEKQLQQHRWKKCSKLM